ncbi:MAG: XdhC family protein [Gemmataceae bacterium]
MRELLGELHQAVKAGRACVWCAIVDTRGSTPQKAGAGMLVFADGSQRGTLGGGCVEAEVKQQALAVLAGQAAGPAVHTFHLDDAYGWDDGLICGGRMTVLADPLLPPAADEYVAAFRAVADAGRGAVEAVAIAADSGLAVGTRLLFDADGRLLARRGEGEGEVDLERIVRHLPDLSRRPKPTVHHGVAYLPLLPRIRLLIVGGGHVGQAVGRLAAETDFDVRVLDDRATYVSAERFPQARERLVGEIGPTLARLAPTLTPDDYGLIVTRGHLHDEEALYHLAPTRAAYVGMIGSKRKIRLIYEDLLGRGIAAADLVRVHAPLGFDIGSQTVPEIAVSIVAELIARRNLGTTDVPPRARVRVGADRP